MYLLISPCTGNITALTTPGTPAKSTPRSPIKKILFDTADNDRFDDDTSISVSSPAKQISTPQAVTPKMGRLFGSPFTSKTATS